MPKVPGCLLISVVRKGKEPAIASVAGGYAAMKNGLLFCESGRNVYFCVRIRIFPNAKGPIAQSVRAADS